LPRRGLWVLLCYRLPREPSTPRISVWRKLRALGVAQLQDGLVGLPLDARNREQLEWVSQDVVDAGGEASIWLAEPTTSGQERQLVEEMMNPIVAEYKALVRGAEAARAEPEGTRRRTLKRLRRELRRIRQRDYFPPPERAAAQAAVDEIAQESEVRS
jgi:hypothetical protein